MTACLGLDIAKQKVDPALLLKNGKYKSKVFANTPKGFTALQQWLDTLGTPKAQVCIEATGAYHEAVATFLFDKGHRVCVVNPQRVKSFGLSEGIRTKNDQVDARLLARFGKAIQPRAWQPEPLPIRDLRALGRRRDELLVMRCQERNRAGLNTESVEESIESLLLSIEKEVAAIEQKIKAHFNSHPDLKEQFARLQSIPGIGPVCAEALLSETGGFERFERVSEVVAFVGLSPQERSSGSSVRGQAGISRKGNSRLRRLLYLPALAAQWANPLVSRFSQRLKEKGKPAKVVICACMKKLLQIAFGVIKQNKAFDPNFAPISP